MSARVAAFCFALMAVWPAPSHAESYPSRPIRLMVGQAPGGHSDVLGRIIAQRFAVTLRQPVVVENRGGAGGTIAAEAVARSAADGYTLLFAGSNNLGLALLVDKDLRYGAQDFAPIGAIARVSYALAVNSAIPATNIAELVAFARANPGKLNYATSGAASMSSLGFDMLKRAAAIDIVAVPYKGSGAAVNDFLSGHVHMMFTDLSMLATLASTGSVRLIAVSGSKRSAMAPDVATVAEQGHPELAIEPWYGLVAPAGTPADIVAKLNEALRDCLRAPEVRSQFERLGYVPIESSAEQLDAMIEQETKSFRSVVAPAAAALR